MCVNEIWCSICCRYMDENCKKCNHFDEQVHMDTGEDPDDVRITNFDKLLDDPENRKLIMELAIDFIPAHFCINTNNMKIDPCIDCEECIFRNKNGINCDTAMIKWLREEYVERR